MNGKHGASLKILKVFATIFITILFTLSVLIARSISWMLHTWSNLTMEELIYHLKSPLDGTNSGMIEDYIYSCLTITILAAIGIILFFIIIRKKSNIYHIALPVAAAFSLLLSGISIYHVWDTLDISTYSSNLGTYSTFIDDNYVDPQNIALTFPEQKRNLIYIFLESMEVTYADKKSGGAFDENIIPELTRLSDENENFSGDLNTLNGGHALNGSTWTVASMFSQSSGLPLLIPIDGNSMSTQDTFFPGLYTIGDILQSAGYEQSLLIGSEAVFGGRKLFYETHGNYNIYDYDYSIATGQLPSDYRVWWGYEDKQLFKFAKEHLLEMSQSEQPFNLTLLTVDTHFEDGYFCPDCPDTFGKNQYANVMSCSSKQVADFINWVQEQDFYENTTIVVSGDHPTMDSDFCESVDENYERKVYTAYINSAVKPETDNFREYSTFDNFPTTLASLGVAIEGERLGLGTNLFSSKQTLIERFGKDTVNNELSKKSVLMDEFTSDVVLPDQLNIQVAANEEEEIIEPEVPPITADITVSSYNYHKGRFDITIKNLLSNTDIQTVRCAVWANEDQQDLIWYESQLQNDGSYLTKVWAKDFAYKEATYNIHVYAIDSSGTPQIIGMTTGEI